jgi:hypothetical protein
VELSLGPADRALISAPEPSPNIRPANMAGFYYRQQYDSFNIHKPGKHSHKPVLDADNISLPLPSGEYQPLILRYINNRIALPFFF